MKLIDIGNSKGVRLSKNIINKYHFENGLNLIEEDDYIKIVPLTKKLRCGWNEFFLKHLSNVDIDIDLEFLECDIGDWSE